MNQNDYKEMKEENDINVNFNVNRERTLSKENNNIKTIINSSYFGSEFNQEEYISINKESYIKGFGLVFIYFSVIIYSLLYMLTPEKTANLIFEGSLNSLTYNYSVYNKNNNFYKLDSIRERINNTILEISRNFLYDNKKYPKNNLLIKIIYSPNLKIISKIVIINRYISKEIDNDIKVYHYYKIKDFPFCLSLFNKYNEDKLDINSDYLNNFSFDI